MSVRAGIHARLPLAPVLPRRVRGRAVRACKLLLRVHRRSPCTPRARPASVSAPIGDQPIAPPRLGECAPPSASGLFRACKRVLALRNKGTATVADRAVAVRLGNAFCGGPVLTTLDPPRYHDPPALVFRGFVRLPVVRSCPGHPHGLASEAPPCASLHMRRLSLCSVCMHACAPPLGGACSLCLAPRGACSFSRRAGVLASPLGGSPA